MTPKFLLIILISSLFSGCCMKSSKNSVVEVIENKLKEYNYVLVLKGVKCYSRHSSDLVSAIFSLPEKKTVVDFLKIKSLQNGVYYPSSFIIENEMGYSFPDGVLDGSVSIKNNQIVINLTVENNPDKFSPYFFNGRYTINK